MLAQVTNMNLKEHWQTIYKTKTPQQVSWTQERPNESIQLFEQCNLDIGDSVIDICGGNSFLIDYFIEQGYYNCSVLDISEEALELAQKRLGNSAKAVNWIPSNSLDFKPTQRFSLWHDRAIFHFLTSKKN